MGLGAGQDVGKHRPLSGPRFPHICEVGTRSWLRPWGTRARRGGEGLLIQAGVSCEQLGGGTRPGTQHTQLLSASLSSSLQLLSLPSLRPCLLLPISASTFGSSCLSVSQSLSFSISPSRFLVLMLSISLFC